MAHRNSNSTSRRSQRAHEEAAPPSLGVLCQMSVKGECVFKDCPLKHLNSQRRTALPLRSVCLDYLASQSPLNERKQACVRKHCSRLHIDIPERETRLRDIEILKDHLDIMTEFCVAVDRRASDTEPTVIVVPIEYIVFTSGIAKVVECFFQFSKRVPYVCYDFLERNCSYGNHCYGIHIRNFEVKAAPHYKLIVPNTVPYTGKEMLCERMRMNEPCDASRCPYAHTLEELTEPSFVVANHCRYHGPHTTVSGVCEDGSVQKFHANDLFVTKGALQGLSEGCAVHVCPDWLKYKQHNLEECEYLHIKRQKKGEAARHRDTLEGTPTRYMLPEPDHSYRRLSFGGSEHTHSPTLNDGASPLAESECWSPQYPIQEMQDALYSPSAQSGTVIGVRETMLAHFQQYHSMTPHVRSEGHKEVEKFFSDCATALLNAREKIIQGIDEHCANRDRICTEVLNQLAALQPHQQAEITTEVVNLVSSKIPLQVLQPHEGTQQLTDGVLRLPKIMFVGSNNLVCTVQGPEAPLHHHHQHHQQQAVIPSPMAAQMPYMIDQSRPIAMESSQAPGQYVVYYTVPQHR